MPLLHMSVSWNSLARNRPNRSPLGLRLGQETRYGQEVDEFTLHRLMLQ
jgi:hypothetical protein